MVGEGVVPTVQQALDLLSMDPEGPVPSFESQGAAGSGSGGGGPGGAGGSGSGNGSGPDGANPTEAKPPTAHQEAAAGEDMVPIIDHPTYAKYFKMLKVGVPAETVKAKMTREGVNPAMLDKDPTELIPRVEAAKPAEADGAADGKKMVPVSEHPKYSKYFRMLKVGLPKPAVKSKMEQEGADPNVLDKDPSDLIPLEEETAGAGPMVPVGEHPKYVKYFKMLKVGLPKDAVKAKMEQEGGVNSAYLDKDPSELVPLDENAKAATKAAPVKKEPKVGR